MTGVILMGGKSSRMGQDKATLSRRGTPLFLYFYQLVEPHCEKVVLSVNENQLYAMESGLPHIVDDAHSQGPMGGLVSCYRQLHQPMLLVPVDMPLLGENEIKSLISLHRPEEECTVFYDVEKKMYEPLLGIWETAILARAEAAFNAGERSVQSFLTREKVLKRPCPFPEKLTSANAPDDWNSMLASLG